MNCAIYETGSNTIRHFIRDAILKTIRDIYHISGSNGSVGLKKVIFSLLWTNDDCNAILDGAGNITGFDKTISQLTPAVGIEIARQTRQELARAVEIRNQVANLTYEQVDTYIENNVTDLASAKEFLKILGKAVLAAIKIQDSR